MGEEGREKLWNLDEEDQGNEEEEEEEEEIDCREEKLSLMQKKPSPFPSYKNEINKN